MSGNTPHPRDLLPSFALDALDEAARGPVEAHLNTCAECRAEVTRLTAMADALAESVVPVTPPPAAHQRLMERIAADRALSHVAGAAVTHPTPAVYRPTPAPDVRVRPRAGIWAVGAVSAGAVALAAFTSRQAFVAQREVLALRARLAELSAQLSDQQYALAELNPPTQGSQPTSGASWITPLQGSGQAAGVVGRLVYQPAGRAAIALIERLPPLDRGRVYQLWLLRGSVPTPAGSFTVDSAGRASVVVRAPERLDSYSGIGLTAEPTPGRATPSGPVLASGSLAPR